jgi:hypothetical protein
MALPLSNVVAVVLLVRSSRSCASLLADPQRLAAWYAATAFDHYVAGMIKRRRRRGMG